MVTLVCRDGWVPGRESRLGEVAGGRPGHVLRQENALSFRPVHIHRGPRRGARRGFSLLSVHWSAALALKEVGKRLARGEQAAAYLVRWDRFESGTDPRLKETS